MTFCRNHSNTIEIGFSYENEAGGYEAELRLTILATPGDPGDRTSPPCDPQFELIDVTVETIATDDYQHKFGPHDTSAETTLAKIVAAKFSHEYETDDSLRESVEYDAANEFADRDDDARESAAEARREQLLIEKPF